MRSMISPGLVALSASYPRPQSSITPGLKFSTSTSASRISARTCSRDAASLRSSVTLRLLRDCTCHHTLVPSWSKRHWRNGSPVPGGSILMTSAPKSAKVFAANGPAISWPNSTTFNPTKGPRASAVWALVAPILVPPPLHGQGSRTARRSAQVLLQQVIRPVVLAQNLGQVRQHFQQRCVQGVRWIDHEHGAASQPVTLLVGLLHGQPRVQPVARRERLESLGQLRGFELAHLGVPHQVHALGEPSHRLTQRGDHAGVVLVTLVTGVHQHHGASGRGGQLPLEPIETVLVIDLGTFGRADERREDPVVGGVQLEK